MNTIARGGSARERGEALAARVHRPTPTRRGLAATAMLSALLLLLAAAVGPELPDEPMAASAASPASQGLPGAVSRIALPLTLRSAALARPGWRFHALGGGSGDRDALPVAGDAVVALDHGDGGEVWAMVRTVRDPRSVEATLLHRTPSGDLQVLEPRLPLLSSRTAGVAAAPGGDAWLTTGPLLGYIEHDLVVRRTWPMEAFDPVGVVAPPAVARPRHDGRGASTIARSGQRRCAGGGGWVVLAPGGRSERSPAAYQPVMTITAQ